MTQQETFLVVVTNAGSHSCAISAGYPYIALLAARNQVDPFRINHHGDQEITNRRPHSLSLTAGAHFYLALNKNDCVMEESHIVRALRIGFQPNVVLRLRLPRYPVIGYCAAGDLGHQVEVSPPTRQPQQAFKTP